MRRALLPFILLAVLLVRLAARCGYLIRFHELWSGRIGHLAANTECLLSEIEAGKHPKSLLLAYHNAPVCNEQLGRMLARTLHIGPFGRVSRANRLFKGWEKFAAEPSQYDRDIHNLWEKQEPKLSFTEAEEKRGVEGLRRLGIHGKWVCLVVRDCAYLPALEYHAYRDTDIKDYTAAAWYLARRGYFVIRMGAKVKDRMDEGFVGGTPPQAGVIDYANSPLRSEFLDIYLGAKCSFCLTNSTGIDAIPAVFRRPLAYVNMVPLEYLGTFHKGSLAIWKHHYRDGKRMSPEEIYESAGLFERTEQYKEAGITLVDNTAEEIRQVAEEMADLVEFKERFSTTLEGTNPPQEDFWRTFPRSVSPYNNRPLHGEIRMRIGREFLRGYSG